MVVLPFNSKCVAKGNPSWTKSRVHQRRLTTRYHQAANQNKTDADIPEVFTCLTPLSTGEIPYTNSIPAYGGLGLFFHQLMSEHKQFRMKIWEMVHACDVQWHCRCMHRNELQNSGSYINIWPLCLGCLANGLASKSQRGNPPIDIVNIMYRQRQRAHQRCPQDQIHQQVARELGTCPQGA